MAVAPLTRISITQSPTLAKILTEGWLQSFIPVTSAFFAKENLVPTEELGAILKSLVDTSSDWLLKTKELKYQVSLQTATTTFLDTIGNGFGIPRLTGEIDDDYAIRIQQEILIERVTTPAILNGLLRIIPGATIFEPWRQLCKPSETFTPSEDCHLGSPDYWNAAVFDAFLYPTSGDIPGISNFLETMKAYGVKAWYTVNIPAQFIDYNNDPLIAEDSYDLLANGLQDPRTSKRDQLVVVTNTELETNDIPDFVEGWVPSGLGGDASNELTPSGFEIVYVVIDIVSDLNLDVRTPMRCGDVIRVAALSTTIPTFNDYLLAGFDLGSGPLILSDLSKNVIIEPDIVASEAAGMEIYDIINPDFYVNTKYTEVQGQARITQSIGLGDPEVLGGGEVLGTPMNF